MLSAKPETAIMPLRDGLTAPWTHSFGRVFQRPFMVTGRLTFEWR